MYHKYKCTNIYIKIRIYRETGIRTTKTRKLWVRTAVTLEKNEKILLILFKKATAKNVHISRDRFAGDKKNEMILLILFVEKLLCKNLVQLCVDPI